MTIIHTSQKYTPEELYRYTKDASVGKLGDHKGEIITVTGYIYYTDDKEDKDGNITKNEVLSLILDDGTALGSNSPTVRRSWFDLLDIYGDTPIYPRNLLVFDDEAKKSGRRYMNIRLA